MKSTVSLVRPENLSYTVQNEKIYHIVHRSKISYHDVEWLQMWYPGYCFQKVL